MKTAVAAQPLPLAGIVVLDFAQFLAGPAAALRLADLGADAIKIERPGTGDLCRALAVNDQWIGNDSLLFHAINRNKKSVVADLKSPPDLEKVKRLISTADVMIHNFRPGVMERIGLEYAAASNINPRIVYGAVTGYGDKGPWRNKPGQDLLAQALSGLTWLSGNADDNPIPIGFPLLDMAAAGNLVQGILAALLRRGVTGRGGLVEVDLMSSAVDLQFEPLTAYFNDDKTPQRSAVANANIYGAAPYGIYRTSDGFLALAMTPLNRLAELLNMDALNRFAQSEAFARRDEIKSLLADAIQKRSTKEWLSLLEPADVWCAEVLDWNALKSHEGFTALEPLQDTQTQTGLAVTTTRCPIRLDGEFLTAKRGAPHLGADTKEFMGSKKQEKRGN